MNQSVVETAQPAEACGSITFLNEEGMQIQVVPRHLGRHEVSFELVSTDRAPRTSEVLEGFRVSLGGRTAYSGRATTTSVTPSGNRIVCLVSLDEPWTEMDAANGERGVLSGAFDGFLDSWRRYYQVRPEFKVIVADMQILLTELELWLSQLELGLQAKSDEALAELRRRWACDLGESTTKTLTSLFEKFEAAAAASPPETRSASRIFARRQLHPLLLCAPFLHRTYRKPLGYAGDYEMVNMISRDPYEGSTLFAQLVNLWFLKQPTPEAHRNRLKHLERRIMETAVRTSVEGRVARILTLGCGPALEIQEFIRKQSMADRVEFTLIDFNQETLDRTGGCIERIKRQERRTTVIELVRKSVMAILRETPGAERVRNPYDFVYCAGLFDYLTDPVCRRVSTYLFDCLRPGGLFLSTNVHVSNPWPLLMDFIADWHLIHRSTAQMLATRPEQAAADECRLTTDLTGVNIFLEATKPVRQTNGLR